MRGSFESSEGHDALLNCEAGCFNRMAIASEIESRIHFMRRHDYVDSVLLLTYLAFETTDNPFVVAISALRLRIFA